MQQQALDRLTLIQSKTESILTQQLELAEYPIPRLFIVLPEEPAKYDPGNWFRTKFRLHFICEGGKNTEASNSNVPRHLHLAKHEGYLIREPTQFFREYGPFLLLMLELIKVGTSTAGHVVPNLASLRVVELIDSVKQSVESVTDKINYSLECINTQLAKTQAQDLANYLSNVEGLKGVELRQLGSFLKTSEDENLLGNLYRITTTDGHVTWVCRDHHRASCQEKHTQNLRDVVKLAHGEFDEQLGRITIPLDSSFAVTEFYNAVIKARNVHELTVELRWQCSKSDFEVMEETLKKSRALKTSATLTTLNLQSNSIGENRAQAVAEALKTNSALTSLSLVGNSIGDKGAQALAQALKNNSTLTYLDLRGYSIGKNGAQALAEALKTNSTLTTLNLGRNSIGDNGTQALAQALKANSTLTTLHLWSSSTGDNGAQALALALQTNATLTTLDLRDCSIGDNGAQALAEALKINSTLTTLNLMSNSIGDNGAQALAEALKVSSTLAILNLLANKGKAA
ncbi:hypothetical protein BGZ81_001003 [Podila clonocystis]|nr:hypothetical protein BGZ81_001003 [Podila clonocystis]